MFLSDLILDGSVALLFQVNIHTFNIFFPFYHHFSTKINHWQLPTTRKLHVFSSSACLKQIFDSQINISVDFIFQHKFSILISIFTFSKYLSSFTGPLA